MIVDYDFTPLMPVRDIPEPLRGCVIERLLQENAEVDHEYFYSIQNRMIGILLDPTREINRPLYLEQLHRIIHDCAGFDTQRAPAEIVHSGMP
jgi:hypothetical protein